MLSRNSVKYVLAFVPFVTICLMAATFAQAGQISSVIFEIQAENDLGTGSYVFEDPEPVFVDGQYSWALPEPTGIMSDTGVTIANLEGANVFAQADPVLALGFVVSSGSATTYTITSPTLSFPSISPASARATAAVTATDISGNGASITGGYAGGTKTFEATYNGGTLFANLVSNASTAVAFDSVTSSEDFPLGGGFTGVGAVSSMQTEFKFTLGAGDSGSGTSSFVVIPEPSCVLLALWGLSAILAARRR